MILAIVLWASQALVKTVEIRKIYVTGNNEAAASVRRKIGRESCFVLAPKIEADGNLLVDQTESAGGVNAPGVLLGSGSTTVVNGQLEAKDGTVLWQDSKQGMPGIVSTGAAGGAGRMLESLYRYSGCDKKGRRQ